MSSITTNVEAVWQKIDVAARRLNRNAGDILLVAVTKTHPLETVIEAYRAGIRHFGENRVEEFQAKRANFSGWLQDTGSKQAAHWHYIGHLQSRQVGPALEGQPSLIHSVDSLKLAQRIDRLARRDGFATAKILLQCNVSGEPSKYGFDLQNWMRDEQRLVQFLEIVGQIAALEKVEIQGLMTIAPYSNDPEASRPIFKSLATLKHKLDREFPKISWQHLSMGMTNDFEVGIEEGATIVRVGRAIFGERDDI